MRPLVFLLLLAGIGWCAYEYLHPTPAPPPPAPPPPPPVVEVPAPPAVINAIVTITGPKGAGTGFICNFRGKLFVATNQHVLAVGSPMTVRTSSGVALQVQTISAAADADVALLQCASYPPESTILEFATLPDPTIQKNDPTLIAGNSKGDGVINQTPGLLMDIGPQHIEVSNSVSAGNSGGPIIHEPSHKVMGVLVESEVVNLAPSGRAALGSSLRPSLHYLGHRVDSVQKWIPLDWATFQQTEEMIKQSRDEVDALLACLQGNQSFKNFKELHDSRNQAVQIYLDRHRSATDKLFAFNRYLREIDSMAKRASTRVAARPAYFSQVEKIETIKRLATAVSEATVIAQRDTSLSGRLLQTGPL